VEAEFIKETNVFPMIPAGAPLRDMIIERPKQKMAKPEGSTIMSASPITAMPLPSSIPSPSARCTRSRFLVRKQAGVLVRVRAGLLAAWVQHREPGRSADVTNGQFFAHDDYL